ncbi:MAG TPA: hypothetical protein VIV58_27310 [Kofleriaceae bacterium]
MFVPQLGILTAIALAGCADVTNAPAPDPSKTLNETAFRCGAEPVLIAQCSYNACHGKDESALRVYSLGKLRNPPATDGISASAPLTDAEQHANFLSAAGFATYGVAPADNWLLKKPLPAADGGFEHAGGAIYTGTGDPNYVALYKWLNGATSCN